MKTRFSLAVVLMVCLCVISLPAAAAGDAAKGKELFATKCKTCHGLDGVPPAAMAKKYEGKLHALGTPEVQKLSDADMSKKFADAANHKALQKTLKDEDIANAIAHIRTLKK
jgi:mono/diheme cytochrome c family protein